MTRLNTTRYDEQMFKFIQDKNNLGKIVKFSYINESNSTVTIKGAVGGNYYIDNQNKLILGSFIVVYNPNNQTFTYFDTTTRKVNGDKEKHVLEFGRSRLTAQESKLLKKEIADNQNRLLSITKRESKEKTKKLQPKSNNPLLDLISTNYQFDKPISGKVIIMNLSKDKKKVSNFRLKPDTNPYELVLIAMINTYVWGFTSNESGLYGDYESFVKQSNLIALLNKDKAFTQFYYTYLTDSSNLFDVLLEFIEEKVWENSGEQEFYELTIDFGNIELTCKQ